MGVSVCAGRSSARRRGSVALVQREEPSPNAAATGNGFQTALYSERLPLLLRSGQSQEGEASPRTG